MSDRQLYILCMVIIKLASAFVHPMSEGSRDIQDTENWLDSKLPDEVCF